MTTQEIDLFDAYLQAALAGVLANPGIDMRFGAKIEAHTLSPARAALACVHEAMRLRAVAVRPITQWIPPGTGATPS